MRVHEKVEAALRQNIAARYRPGDRLPPIRDLARRFKVSPAAICQSLVVLAHEGLVERRQRSGVYVRERVDERPVGVVMGVDFAVPQASYFWRQVTQQVRSRLAARGVRSRLYAGFYQPGSQSGDVVCQEFVEDAANNRLKGVIVTHGGARSDWMRSLKQHHVPVVGYLPEFENYVTFDLVAAVRAATLRLLEAGRRKLAFMDWGSLHPLPDFKDQFVQAFSDALAEHGVRLNEQWVRCDFHPNLPGAGWEEFREIWMGSAEKPDGLVVTDDVLFRGVARAIGEFGIRVPEQLLVATHANRGAMEDYPFPQWRMVTDPNVAADAQVDLLLTLLRGEPVTQRQVILPVQLDAPAIGDSTSTEETRETIKGRSSLS